MNNINITIYGLIFTILLIIVYFSKKRADYMENKIYSLLIISSLVGTLVEISSFIAVLTDCAGDSLLYTIIIKFLFENFLIWMFLFTLYFITITFDKTEKERYNIFFKALLLLCCMIIITSFLPFSIEKTNGLLLPVGMGVNAIYFMCGICIIIMIFLLAKNIKRIKNKKYWPLVLILVLFSGMAILQKIYPGILLVNPAAVLITFVMYFTIENPDIHMIEQLNIAKDQAEKANLAKTDFLSNMSHEIRTPLNAIVGFSSLLLENENVPDEAKEEVQDIIMASDNLLEIVNGILDISKIEADKLEIINSEYSFSKLFDELVSLTKGRLGDKPIEFKSNCDKSIPAVLYGDKQRIKQVAINVLTNAVKYTKKGSIDFKVDSVLKDDICRLIISVEDTGIGIKEGNINKLFNRFERLNLEDNITIEGTGLGLAITKKLVDLMGGTIVVQSIFGKGSKFTISIDQRVVKKPTIKVEKKAKNAKITKAKNKKVLLVDDNKINLKVAERLLSTYGVETESVESGFICLEKLKEKNEYDLILLDDMMPKMSGVQTLRKIKKEIKGFKTPVVALTANALTGMKEKYLKDGFDDYLAKPIEKQELDRVINEYLNKK